MNSLEMAKRITAELGEQAPTRDVLAKAANLMKSELQAGNAVDMFGVVRMQLTPAGLCGEAKGKAAVNVFPLPGLLPTHPAVHKTESRVALVVEAIDPFSKIIQKKLSAGGRTVELVEGVQALMELVKKETIDAIAMDAELELSDDVRHWLKTDPRRSLISLIALYQTPEAKEQVNSLRICEDAVLVEPFEAEELGELIDSEITRVSAEKKHFLHVMSSECPALPEYQQVMADLLETVTRKSGLSEEGRMGLIVAFREAVDNAIRHGSRANDNAKVSVAYVLDSSKITVTITDEGPGFDSSVYIESRVSGDAVAAARARHKEGRRGGLGIMLMLKSVDRLEYNREGNVAKLTKFLKPQR